MTQTIDTNITIGSLVAGDPMRARVFETFRIDYCCGGNRTLAEVCAKQQLDPADVIQALEEQAATLQARDTQVNWEEESLTSLIRHLLDTHHVYLKDALARLQPLADKVARVHGENHPELLQVRQTFMELSGELLPHMAKEEMILFPLIERMEASGGAQGFHCGSIGNPIGVMEFEHDAAGVLMARLRELTSDYALPPDACGSYQALYAGLADLEFDTHMHIHKENVLLFPRALALESACQ